MRSASSRRVGWGGVALFAVSLVFSACGGRSSDLDTDGSRYTERELLLPDPSPRFPDVESEVLQPQLVRVADPTRPIPEEWAERLYQDELEALRAELPEVIERRIEREILRIDRGDSRPDTENGGERSRRGEKTRDRVE